MILRKRLYQLKPGRSAVLALIFLATNFVVFIQHPAYGADLESALKVYNRGNFAAAHTQFLELANAGHAHAQFYLGEIYEGGISVSMNQQAAFKWYQKAALQNQPNAQSRLAAMYLDGRGVPVDKQRAFHWYEKAAQLGDVIAQYYLAEFYATGTGTGKNLLNAYTWWTIAASYGDPDAIHRRATIVALLSDKEIVHAQALAREWEAERERSLNR